MGGKFAEQKNFLKAVMVLVIPMALQNLINVGVTAADVLMLGQLSEIELYQAIEDETFLIMEAIRKVLEDAPPELVGDIYDNGLLLTGGGALLGGLTQLIKRTLGINCNIAKDAVNCVAKGTGMAFESMTALLDVFEAATVYKYR